VTSNQLVLDPVPTIPELSKKVGGMRGLSRCNNALVFPDSNRNDYDAQYIHV